MPSFTLSQADRVRHKGLPTLARALEWELDTLGVPAFRIRTERTGIRRAEMRVEWQQPEDGLPRRMHCRHLLSALPSQRPPLTGDGPHFGISAWLQREGCF